MLELTKEQKVQIAEGRRLSVARNVFDIRLDIVVMTAQGRTQDVAVLNQRIQELEDTDAALVEFISTL